MDLYTTIQHNNNNKNVNVILPIYQSKYQYFCIDNVLNSMARIGVLREDQIFLHLKTLYFRGGTETS